VAALADPLRGFEEDLGNHRRLFRGCWPNLQFHARRRSGRPLRPRALAVNAVPQRCDSGMLPDAGTPGRLGDGGPHQTQSRCISTESFRATATTARFFAAFPPRSASFNPKRRSSVSGPKGPRMYCDAVTR